LAAVRLPGTATVITTQRLTGCLLLVGFLGACSIDNRPPAGAATLPAGVYPLRVPADSLIPEGPLGTAIRRGRALLVATKDSLPGHVGNRLTCANCHLNAGTKALSSPWVGVYGRFPEYRSRNNKINLMLDRINDCFQRSMNGKALDPNSRDASDIIAYFAFLSKDTPVGGRVEGQGFARLTPLEPDTARGEVLFGATCAVCHGSNGEGTAVGPPLWGDDSFSIGAGMARLRTMAAFIRYNMPLDRPGSLTDQEAFDLAAYVNGHSRPDFVGKENDWPLGNPPPDVAYATRAADGKH